MRIRLFFTLLAALATACDEKYIDDISSVGQGPDLTAPAVSILYPNEGQMIQVKEEVAPITINFEVKDDIEVGAIKLELDGNSIATLTDFKDYRKVLSTYTYNTLTNGAHVLKVTASDKSGKSTITSVNFQKVAPYKTKYDGEIFYMPFDGDYLDLVSVKYATAVSSPGFSSENKKGGKSYAGAVNSYLTFPTAGLLGSQFSATFWYKMNATPDRSGILTIGPPDPNNPTAPNNRKNGFRLFREGGPSNQTIKLNVGNGDGDSWYDGGSKATIDPTVKTGWVHVAFTISGSSVSVYLDGVEVSQGSFPGVNWSGCDVLSVASGAPRFTEWGHLSDLSLYDELRLFNKALTKEEVKAVMDGN